MQEKTAAGSENFSPAPERRSVTAASSCTAADTNDEIVRIVRRIIGLVRGESVKERLREVARLLRLPFNRVADYRYGEVRRIEAHEADQIRRNAKIAKREILVRMHAEYLALRAEVVAEAPAGLEWVAPPAVAPLPIFEFAAELLDKKTEAAAALAIVQRSVVRLRGREVK